MLVIDLSTKLPTRSDYFHLQTPLRNLDCLILTALTQTPTHNPDPMIGEFCRTVVDTTRQVSGAEVLRGTDICGQNNIDVM